MRRLLFLFTFLLLCPLIAEAQIPTPVRCVSGCGGSDTADDADFTAGTTTGTPAMGVYESSPTSVTDGDLGTVGITQTRALRVSVDSGAIAVGSEVTAGTAATLTDNVTRIGCVRDDATTTLDAAHADGDYTPCRVNARGELIVSQGTALGPTIDGVNIGGDPCSKLAKTTTPISLIADTVIIAAVSAKKNYICSLSLIAATAEFVSIVEGTGSVCATNEAALLGSTTDLEGMPLGATSGFALIGGNATVLAGKTANVDTCLTVGTAGVRVAGFITWVQE